LLIDDLVARRGELESELHDVAASSAEPARSLVTKAAGRFMSFGFLLTQYLSRAPLEEMVASARREFQKRTDGLQNPSDRGKVDRAIEAAVTIRRLDALIILHRTLKLWLLPHVIFTSLMLALMVVHIIQVIYFT